MATEKKARINMRVPTSLLEWAKEFASKKNTNVTRIFVEHLTKLQEKEIRNAGTSVTR